MTNQTRGIPLGAWLSDLPDDGLIRLLQLRPDLAQPAPTSVAALASRAQARQSVQAATDELDLLRLAVVDALLVLRANIAPVPLADLIALIGPRSDSDTITAAVADLSDRALVWGGDPVRVTSEAAAGLPWFPGQVVLDPADRSDDDLRALLDGLHAEAAELLDRLVEGSPLGRTRDAAPDAPAERPVPRLLAAGLLLRID
ncbi:MAG TPA: DNA-binding protein, partial [Mycobacterium sp.]|nr:DNA-binding protein [Mycobacterium sp.]